MHSIKVQDRTQIFSDFRNCTAFGFVAAYTHLFFSYLQKINLSLHLVDHSPPTIQSIGNYNVLVSLT